MTIGMLLKNTIKAAKLREKKRNKIDVKKSI
jgi:5,10-methylene-tetrahydrofolate dehydrogenase/methenyl tetrahydrofolate cyclohydrolase